MAERRVRRLLVRSVEEPLEAVSINDLVRHRDRQSVQGRQLEVRQEGLLRGYQGYTGQGE